MMRIVDSQEAKPILSESLSRGDAWQRSHDGEHLMPSPRLPTRAGRSVCFVLAGGLVLFAASLPAHAQGLVKGVQQGAQAGNKAAGPVGGVLGGAIGGVVGVFTGVLGVPAGNSQAPAQPEAKQAGPAKGGKKA